MNDPVLRWSLVALWREQATSVRAVPSRGCAGKSRGSPARRHALRKGDARTSAA